MLGVLGGRAFADSKTGVDLVLVLAIDVSDSMTDASWQLERQGYIDAFESPAVAEALRETGTVAVEVVEWGTHQNISVPWFLISDEVSREQFVALLSQMGRTNGGGTYLQDALVFCASTISTSRYAGARSVIDVSGDGTDNRMGSDPNAVVAVHNRILGQGIVINGLPIRVNSAGADAGYSFSVVLSASDTSENVVRYYRQYVIGGPGSFLLPANGYGDFAPAILKKLVQEIS